MRGFSPPQVLTELLAETPSLKTSTSTVTRQVFVFFSLCYMELNTNIKPPWRWPTVLHKLDEDEHKTSNKQFCSKLPQRESTKSKQWLFFQGEGLLHWDKTVPFWWQILTLRAMISNSMCLYLHKTTKLIILLAAIGKLNIKGDFKPTQVFFTVHVPSLHCIQVFVNA